MNKQILLIICLMFSGVLLAQSDSLYLAQQKQIQTLELRLSEQERVLNGIGVKIKSLESEDARLHSTIEESEMARRNESLEIRKEIETNKNESNAQSAQILGDLNCTQKYGIIAIVIVLLLSIFGIVLYLVLRKSNSSSFEKLKVAQSALQEEGIKLDGKLIELLEKQMSVQKIESSKSDQEVDHSLALKVADEIIRIETNLSRMDSSVKGIKPLSAAVRRIKDNFLANGYEMVDMLGKPYIEGMKAVVNFESNDSIEEGKPIITSVIKPQINYKGVMIQTAQITVSQK